MQCVRNFVVGVFGLLCVFTPLLAHEASEEAAAAPDPSRLEPHQRTASGTAWQPDESPMHAIHRPLGPTWSLMLHGLFFAGYDRQGGPRGSSRGFAPNWFMAMAERPIPSGRLGLRGMFSLDPLTVRPRGYPELFQTGETFEGRPLVDAQHPHDFFMEIAALYTAAASDRTGLQIYAAPVGEPALGPVAFPHRISAMENPVAVLGHHLQDSTHIAFGVLTAGLIHRRVKIEGSWFNGHEPDEERWGFESIRLNSFSGRLSWVAGRRWSFQLSRGWIDSPEELLPGEDVTRSTASVLYARSGAGSRFAAALVWGRNDEEHDREDSLLLEGTLTLREKSHLFGRLERLDRTGLIDVTDPESGPQVKVNALSLGATRDLLAIRKMPLGLGGMVTVYEKDDVLDPVYGDHPVSLHLFLRIRPPTMSGSGHH
jgi:hypothetical protein